MTQHTHEPSVPAGKAHPEKKEFGGWLAALGGGRPEIMAEVRGSESRFRAMGAVLVATAAVAAISAAFAFSMALDLPLPVAGILGVGWGALILIIDRALIQTMSYSRGWGYTVLAVLPRIAIALVLGVVISTPLVLRIFEKEIGAELERMRQETAELFEDQRKNSEAFKEMTRLEAQIAGLRRDIDAPAGIDVTNDPAVRNAQAELNAATAAVQSAKDAAVSPGAIDPSTDPRVVDAQKTYDAALADYNAKHTAAQCELDGTCGTARPGDGDAYRAAKAAEDQALATLEAAQTALTSAKQAAIAAQEGSSEQSRSLASTELAAAQERLLSAQASLAQAKETAAAELQRSGAAEKQTFRDTLAELEPQLATRQAQDAALQAVVAVQLANYNGILARLEALDRIGDQRSVLQGAQLLLAALFVLIELAPVLIKAMMNSGKSTYEQVVQNHDRSLIDAVEKSDAVAVRQAELDASAEVARHEDLLERQRSSTQMINQEVVEVQRQVIRDALDEWRERALLDVAAQAAQRRAAPDPPMPPGTPYVEIRDITNERQTTTTGSSLRARLRRWLGRDTAAS